MLKGLETHPRIEVTYPTMLAHPHWLGYAGRLAKAPEYSDGLPAKFYWAPQTDQMGGSELGDVECGSGQVAYSLARLSRSSYRFGNLSWGSYRESFQASFPNTFLPQGGACAVSVLRLRRARTLNLTCRP